MPDIEIKDLLVTYELKKHAETTAVHDFNAVFKSNEISVIIGESGCGKTTLLKTICGLLDYEGDILVNGEDYSKVPFENRSLSYVDQNIMLYPKFTIYDNIAFPLNPKKYTRSQMDEKIKTIASEFGIFHCLTRLPKHLSIGQCQRASIAKALVREPEIILFDEPVSSVDPEVKNEILAYLKEYKSSHDCTMVYVTHNISEAFLMADEIFVMKDGEVVDHGSKEEILKSANPETVALISAGGERK